jgi:hypothetical protein
MPKSPKSNLVREVRLIMSVHGGGDAFGPFFATLTLDKPFVELLLRRADIFRAAHKMGRDAGEVAGNDLYQTTYFDYSPQFFESGKSLDPDSADSPEARARLEEIFEEETYPTDGLREVMPDDGDIPEDGTVRLDYCKMIISAMSQSRPGQVDYRWEACIKHTDEEISTADLTEEAVRALLGRLA